MNLTKLRDSEKVHKKLCKNSVSQCFFLGKCLKPAIQETYFEIIREKVYLNRAQQLSQL